MLCTGSCRGPSKSPPAERPFLSSWLKMKAEFSSLINQGSKSGGPTDSQLKFQCHLLGPEQVLVFENGPLQVDDPLGPQRDLQHSPHLEVHFTRAQDHHIRQNHQSYADHDDHQQLGGPNARSDVSKAHGGEGDDAEVEGVEEGEVFPRSLQGITRIQALHVALPLPGTTTKWVRPPRPMHGRIGPGWKDNSRIH
ncbi:hypothetical protein EYF80_031092 [Liparis tanakae]|uniref:Uncharacterized protein n=1 Tax=Liparis tanakae TaxID=230148 RepID=A0A4Z2GYJ0_9TELE|nr:hypothetical protein EYF80_031092 [Liparis tanakae]